MMLIDIEHTLLSSVILPYLHDWLLSAAFREDFSFTPYTTYVYMKLGRKAPLLKNQTHTLSMKMRTTGTVSAVVSEGCLL